MAAVPDDRRDLQVEDTVVLQCMNFKISNFKHKNKYIYKDEPTYTYISVANRRLCSFFCFTYLFLRICS